MLPPPATEGRHTANTDLFDPDAVDLSGIAGDPRDLVATDLVHQAVIRVDGKAPRPPRQP